MKRLILLCVVSVLAAGLTALSAAESSEKPAAVPVSNEAVFLKDGGIVEGKIEQETDAEIQLTLPGGEKKSIARGEVLRVLYHDGYKRKRYVNLMDGRVLTVYVVDEDKTSYTFRSELQSPEAWR